MEEIELSLIDFENNRDALIDAILQHRQQSACAKCQWKIAVVGRDSLNEIEGIEKPCLFKVNLELEYLGKAIEILQRDHQFEEDTTYKPTKFYLMGAVLAYCE